MDRYLDDHDRVAHATRKVGRGLGMWNEDEGVVVHAAVQGVTFCGVRVGGFSRGWFAVSYRDPVTCTRCLGRRRRS